MLKIAGNAGVERLFNHGGGILSYNRVLGNYENHCPDVITAPKDTFTLAGGTANMFHKFCAFTLAEVLITLGIIGIVAAMTIPTLISNYQKKQYVARLQKGIAVLNNGYRLMMADEGVYDYSKLSLYSDCEKANVINPSEDTRKCLNEHYSKYFRVTKYAKSASDTDFYSYDAATALNGASGFTWAVTFMKAWHGFATQDNMLFWPLGFTASNLPNAVIDVNGKNSPNRFGRDIFFLKFNNGYYSAFGSGGDWNDASDNNEYCGDDESAWTYGFACSGRIVDEGWKMNY